MPFQRDLARESGLHQSRISVFETPGAANITLETLAKIAAGLRLGVIVKFVPFSEMLRWENSFSPDSFNVVPRLDQDTQFLNPEADYAADALTMKNDLATAPELKKRVDSVKSSDGEKDSVRNLSNSDQQMSWAG
jgi:hypothetical protein